MIGHKMDGRCCVERDTGGDHERIDSAYMIARDQEGAADAFKMFKPSYPAKKDGSENEANNDPRYPPKK